MLSQLCAYRAAVVFIAAVVTAHGFEEYPFKLSNTIMGMLIGTTTINVLVPIVQLANYLFGVEEE